MSLDCYNHIHLKLIVEQNKNLEVKSIISALERWDDMQNYGNRTKIKIYYLILYNCNLVAKLNN